MKELLPLFLKLEEVPCLVVGGGEIASRRVAALVRAGARVRVVSPDAVREIRDRAGRGEIRLLRRRFLPRDLRGRRLVIDASGDRRLAPIVAAESERRGIWCSVVDRPEHGNAYFGSIIRRGPVTVAISTSGASPALASFLRRWLERILPGEVGAIARSLRGLRCALLRRWRDPAVRTKILHELLGKVLAPVRPGAAIRLRGELRRLLGPACGEGPVDFREWRSRRRPPAVPGSAGIVHLVGAGPGDPDLISLRGSRLLATADVVLHDRLVGAELLDLCRPDCRVVDVGKVPGGGASTRQDSIHRLLALYARRGLRVVRLKGGDPFVFGRGGEEALALSRAGIPVDIVPGISGLSSVPAAAGIPVTHRGSSNHLIVLTGTMAAGITYSPDQWRCFAGSGGTVVVFMPVRNLAGICHSLIAGGMAASTPAALVENGTLPEQRVVAGNLGVLPLRARRASLRSPALLIVGETVRLRKELGRIAGLASSSPVPSVRE